MSVGGSNWLLPQCFDLSCFLLTLYNGELECLYIHLTLISPRIGAENVFEKQLTFPAAYDPAPLHSIVGVKF